MHIHVVPGVKCKWPRDIYPVSKPFLVESKPVILGEEKVFHVICHFVVCITIFFFFFFIAKTGFATRSSRLF